MRVYLIRHGQTEGNLQKKYVGKTDEGLCKEGIERITEIQKKGIYPIVDKVFTSPMLRCRETAKILYPKLEFTTVQGLQEMDFGEFEYHNYQELSGNQRYQEWIDSGGVMAFPEGESREQFESRSTIAFEQRMQKLLNSSCETVAFVVHGGTIMALLHAFGVPHEPYFSYQCQNGEGYSCKMHKNGERLELCDIQKIVEEGEIPDAVSL